MFRNYTDDMMGMRLKHSPYLRKEFLFFNFSINATIAYGWLKLSKLFIKFSLNDNTASQHLSIFTVKHSRLAGSHEFLWLREVQFIIVATFSF